MSDLVEKGSEVDRINTMLEKLGSSYRADPLTHPREAYLKLFEAITAIISKAK